MRTTIAALLCTLALTGCAKLPTEVDPTTPAQERTIEYCRMYADKIHTHLRAVIFSKDTFPVTVDGKFLGEAASWALADSDTIVFWAEYVERPSTWDLIPAYAAHEVCHLYYNDKDESGAVEARAEACARELMK